jgi:hypothetical protein
MAYVSGGLCFSHVVAECQVARSDTEYYENLRMNMNYTTHNFFINMEVYERF